MLRGRKKRHPAAPLNTQLSSLNLPSPLALLFHFLEDVRAILDFVPDFAGDVNGRLLLHGERDAVAGPSVDLDDFPGVQFVFRADDETRKVRLALEIVDDDAVHFCAQRGEQMRDEIVRERTLLGRLVHEHPDGRADGFVHVDHENLLLIPHEYRPPVVVRENCPDLDRHDLFAHTRDARRLTRETQEGEDSHLRIGEVRTTECVMPEDHSDNYWDEYDWERFLQDQERRTEKYMGLLEKHMDDPNRDEIIAREMGWTHLIGGETRDWEEEVESTFEDPSAEDAQEHEEGAPDCFGFEKHPLYRQAIAFTAEVDELFAGATEMVREHPSVIELHSQTTLAAAKLAAALNDDDIDELGMSIAYLKRALRALTCALDSAVQMRKDGVVEYARFELLRARIFAIRDGIVSTMGDYRSEFRRRHGSR